MRDQIAPTSLEEDYEQLGRTLEALAPRLLTLAALSPNDIAVLRCLVVHNWRRLVLKHPQAPRGLVRKDGPYHRCHLAVDALLNRYPRPALRDIALESTSG